MIIIKGGPGSGHYGHRGRPGKRGGSLPGGGTSDIGRFFVAPVGARIIKPLTPEQKALTVRAYQESTPPVPHFESLEVIQTEHPGWPWWEGERPIPKEEIEYAIESGGGPPYWTSNNWGIYLGKKEKEEFGQPIGIRINPNLYIPSPVTAKEGRLTVLSSLLSNVLTHELGHHLVATRELMPAFPQEKALWKRISEMQTSFREMTPEENAEMGMTTYAGYHPEEILSEAYVSWLLGTPEQKERLYDYLRPVWDLEEAFGP